MAKRGAPAPSRLPRALTMPPPRGWRRAGRPSAAGCGPRAAARSPPACRAPPPAAPGRPGRRSSASAMQRRDLGAEAAGERVLVRDDRRARSSPPSGRPPRSRAAGWCAGRGSRSRCPRSAASCAASSAALHQRPPGDQGHVRARPHQARPPERHRVVGPGVGLLGVGLPVEVLVLEEQHRVLAADAPCAAGRPRRWRTLGMHHAQPGTVGEDALAALAVVGRAALQVAAVGRRAR